MRTVLTVAALTLLATAATAQAPTGPLGGLSCSGKAVTIRYGTIKPGKAALFKKAVADHQAWYRAHGNGTTVETVRVTTRSGTKLIFDDGAALTIVTYDPKPQPAHDAAYDAFVGEYRDSQDLKEEHRGCLG